MNKTWSRLSRCSECQTTASVTINTPNAPNVTLIPHWLPHNRNLKPGALSPSHVTLASGCFVFIEGMPFHMWVLVFSICSTSVVETVPGPSPLTLPLTGVVNQAAKGHTGHCVCYARRALLDKTAPLIVPCRLRVHTNWTTYSRLTQELTCWLVVQNEVACPSRMSWISQISSLRIQREFVSWK